VSLQKHSVSGWRQQRHEAVRFDRFLGEPENVLQQEEHCFKDQYGICKNTNILARTSPGLTKPALSLKAQGGNAV
jgi:endo-1,4-beta-mannosidase